MNKIALLLTSFLFIQQVNAQGVSTTSEVERPTTSEPTSTDRIERMEVTGSHIKRIDVEGTSPVKMIDSDEFVKSGSIEIGQVLREDPAFEAVYGNVGHVRFRGQHAGNVLILLNGMRLPKLNGGYYTSIRNIPTAALKRVEMLKDGGSAIYGSDAMSGVMNFIVKDNYDGNNVAMSTSVAQSGVGTQRNIEGTFGKSFSRGNIMGVIQYESSDGFFESEVDSVNRRDNISPVKTSTVTVGPSKTGLKVGPICDGQVCSTDDLAYDQARPDNEDVSALLTGSYDFGEVTVSALGLFSQKNATRVENPLRLDWSNQAYKGGDDLSVVFSDMKPSAYKDQIAGAGIVKDDRFSVGGQLYDELGDYILEAKEMNYNLQTSVEGYLGHNWDWKVQSSYAVADFEEEVVSGEADQNELRRLFLNGELNLLANRDNKAIPESAKINPVYRNKGELFTTKGVLSGQLFDLGSTYKNGGPISMALTAEFQSESFAFNNDEVLTNGVALGRPTRNYSGSRTVNSAAAELSIFPVKELEIQLAGRVDHYSDVGTTTNPKVALAFRPIKQVLLRSSFSGGFRAPGITDIYAGEESKYNKFRDAVTCNGDPKCKSQYYDVTTYTTDEIKPETSKSYSFGTVIQPFARTSIAIDQWNFEGENTITKLYPDAYTELERSEGAGALAAIGASINRNDDGTISNMRTPRVVNLGSRTLRGFDVAINSDIALKKDNDFFFGNGLSFIFERKDKRFSFEDEEENPDTWKNKAYLGLRNEQNFIRFSMLTVSKQMVGRDPFKETLPQYTEYDMTFGHNFDFGARLSLSVKNLANTRPPAQNDDYLTFGSPDRNYSSFSPLRRRLYVSYSQNF
jgi:iron complex outermembrane receptor protein